MFARVYLCLRLFTYDYNNLLVAVYLCLPMSIRVTFLLVFAYVCNCYTLGCLPVYPCLLVFPMFTHVYQCLKLFSRVCNVYSCLPMFNTLLMLVYLCLSTFTRVHLCYSYSSVYSCSSMFTLFTYVYTVYLCLHC